MNRKSFAHIVTILRLVTILNLSFYVGICYIACMGNNHQKDVSSNNCQHNMCVKNKDSKTCKEHFYHKITQMYFSSWGSKCIISYHISLQYAIIIILSTNIYLMTRYCHLSLMWMKIGCNDIIIFVVRFCYHRNIPMMIFAAYYGFTIDCNCNIAAYNLVIVGRNLPELWLGSNRNKSLQRLVPV
jgi:hypothetical protein